MKLGPSRTVTGFGIGPGPSRTVTGFGVGPGPSFKPKHIVISFLVSLRHDKH